MVWTYEQSTGKMFQNGAYIGTGYAGKGADKNNPDSQQKKNLGPLPRGKYTIGKAYNHPKLGPVSMYLDPTGGQDMFGRSDFFIHGDSKEHPGEASNGCIVISRNIREQIDDSSDKTLDVIV